MDRSTKTSVQRGRGPHGGPSRPRAEATSTLSELQRVLVEVARRPTPREIEDAVKTLGVRTEGALARIVREEGAPPLFTEPSAETPRPEPPAEARPSAEAPREPPAKALRAERVRIEPDVYSGTPTAAARVRLLEAAGTIASHVDVHVRSVSAGTHRGQLAIDLPRRIVRSLGIASAEPGDRFTGARFAHAFFDDEALIEEANDAGLRLVRRRGPWVTLERPRTPEPEKENATAATFATELRRALGIVRRAEHLRLSETPERATETMRAQGRRAPRRGPLGRARLRRAIGWVDAFFLGGPNCLRRTLAEVGLDAGAAEEALVFGLDVGRTGHVALKDSEDGAFDVVFEVPPRLR